MAPAAGCCDDSSSESIEGDETKPELPCAGDLALENSHNNFERGRTDTFVLQAAPVGSLSKLRLSFKPRGLFPDWHLDHVKVQCGANGQIMFPYKQWISKAGVYELSCNDSSTQEDNANSDWIDYRVRCLPPQAWKLHWTHVIII